MGSCLSVQESQPPVKSYTPPVASTVVYPPPTGEYTKPSAPPVVSSQAYTYAYPQQPQTQWVNPSYQGQMYPPQQYQQYQMYQQPRYVVAQPYQQQQQGPSTGMAVAGGIVAGMLAASVLDDIGDP